MHTVAIAYHAFYKQCLYCMCCMHSRVSMLHMNCPIMGNSFCMNSFWGSLKLNLLRAPKMLRLALQLLQELTSYSQQVEISLFCFYFHLFFFLEMFFLPIMLKILLQVSIFCSKLSYIASYLIMASYTYICILTPYTHHGQLCIARLVMSLLYIQLYGVSKCQFLT